MTTSFTGYQGTSTTAKPGVVWDGELVTVKVSDGYTVTSSLSSYSAFLSNPSRSATGVWSVTMRDPSFKVILAEIKSVLPDGYYLSSQLNSFTTTSTGLQVINWTFNSAGTPADLPTTLPANTVAQFLITYGYGSTSF